MLADLGLGEEFQTICPVMVFDAAEGQADSLVQAFNTLFKSEEYDGHLLKPIRREVQKGKSVFHCVAKGNQVAVCFGPPEQEKQ